MQEKNNKLVPPGIAETVPKDSLAIKDCIFMVRGVQVMVDWDLASLYQVETRVINQAVKRNLNRFPERFRFQLTKAEMHELITKCDKSNHLKHYPGLPWVFTEEGIAMLSTVLRSQTAVEVSIRIMDVFVEMRRTLSAVAPYMQMLKEWHERYLVDQAHNEERFAQIFKELGKLETPVQGVFFNGQIWDAHILMITLIAKAEYSITLIDNYVDITTLDMLSKKQPNVKVEIVTSSRGNMAAESDIRKFNAQYPTVNIKVSSAFHDRFLILDEKELYLIGASLKDLGKKCFGFTQMDASLIPEIMSRI